MSSTIIAFNDIVPIVSASMPIILFISGMFKFKRTAHLVVYLTSLLLLLFVLIVKNIYPIECTNKTTDGLYSIKLDGFYQHFSLFIFFIVPFFVVYDFYQIYASGFDPKGMWFLVKDIIVFLIGGVMYINYLFKSKCTFKTYPVGICCFIYVACGIFGGFFFAKYQKFIHF